jgi:hypothetical protein
MTCQQCGSANTEGSAACSWCGSSLAGVQTPGGTAYSFQLSRLTRNDQVVTVASVVLLISLFLPWFGVSLGAFGNVTADGPTAHGYLWIAFVVVLAIIGFQLMRAGFQRLPFKLPLTDGQLQAAATGLNVFLVVLAFVLKPGGFGSGVGWQFGAFVALAAAAIAAGFAAQQLRSGPSR